jgi:Family of unknown function (DUF6390)
VTAEITREPSTRGWELFARYAFPPNELGYCGPPDASKLLSRIDGESAVADHAKGFDGAWPYLEDIATAAGVDDPLDADVVRNYWLGGELLGNVDSGRLLAHLREAFAGQPTGLLDDMAPAENVCANHSFHVFVVYPWVRFLDGDPATPLRILQNCRIRWGTVDSVDDEHTVIVSPPLLFDGALVLGDPVAETVRWSRGGTSLAPVPVPGETVAAHWDWVCGSLTEPERADVAAATQRTLDLVNFVRA